MGIHSSNLVQPLPRTGRTRGHLWTQTSGCPLLHPGLTACTTTGQTRGLLWPQKSGCPLRQPGLTPEQDWLDQGASLDSDKWVSTPPSWSDSFHHYLLDQGHVLTQSVEMCYCLTSGVLLV